MFVVGSQLHNRAEASSELTLCVCVLSFVVRYEIHVCKRERERERMS